MKMRKGKKLITILLAAFFIVAGMNVSEPIQAATISEAELTQLYLNYQQMLVQSGADQAAAAQAAAEQQALLAQQAAAAQAALPKDANGAIMTSPAGMPETYVDINLTTQTVVYYLNGVAVLVSPCVTGNPNKGRATPTGFYSIKAMVPGKRLKGPNWDVWVNYWMRFTDGAIGLHDASWRSSFGGTIYQTNGSHGCVNLPSQNAATLYSMVTIGTPVVVHI